ncbi:hypothetical protein GCM10028857_26710 [Salinarchaeum chitinilyticum]
MSDERDATAASTTNQGPELLAQRPLTGILVHLLGLFTLAAGPAVAYLVSEHEFTRRNARNATNWQLFFLVTFIGSVAAVFGLSELQVPDAFTVPEAVSDAFAVPDVVATAFGFLAVLLVFAWFVILMLLSLLNFVFPLIATGKAIFGEAWTYPVAPDAVGWIAARTVGREPWRLALLGYVVVVPLAAGSLAGVAVGVDVLFSVAFALILAAFLGSGLAVAALLRDVRALQRANAAWRPNWPAFLAPPAVAGVGTALLASPLWDSANPAGDAIYAFMGVLWLTTVVYLLVRWRRVGASAEAGS